VNNPLKNKFNKVVVLDTVIFYPEHEAILKELVKNPKIERVPLEYNQKEKNWELPENYRMPEDATIIIWPSSLPESFDGITPEIHEKLKTAYCYVEEGLRDNIPAQNLLNRIGDADCVITCWTAIPDVVLEKIKPKAIITWTHEYEHRLNVTKAHEKGIYTASVDDYGTDAVAELELNMLLELIERNKKTDQKAKTEEDYTIGVLLELFRHYRKTYINEKNTRKGKFSHQFHKIGRSLKHYGDFTGKSLDDVVPPKLLEGKNIGFFAPEKNLNHLIEVLQNGFGVNVAVYKNMDSHFAGFYKLLSLNDIVIFDSKKIDTITLDKIKVIKKGLAIDLQSLSHFNETLKNKILGVIGLGRIGNNVARIAAIWGMKVCYSGTDKNNKYEHLDLDDLIKNSDIISLNVKAHKAKNLLSRDKIQIIKTGSYFINTSDGNALDQSALTERMLSNEVYCGLDVYPGLPTTKTMCLDNYINGKLQNQLANHVLTYRAGWGTQESIKVKTYKLLGHMIRVLSESQ
jgi:lactate dehydrogenase-like 2-hydroxyacid dehydrogenase